MYKRILITTDGSNKSRLDAKDGIELAKALGAQVIALNVVSENVIASAVRQLGSDRKDAEAMLKARGQKAIDEIKKMGDDAGIKVDAVLKIGVPANEIIEVASSEKVDLIVIGSHGESGEQSIGGVVRKVVYLSTTPVLVVR
ncbi:MAG: universal stress protein [Methanotrichaceae archaeon]|jgi:nucleotide-binding universal stress UspA family protein